MFLSHARYLSLLMRRLYGVLLLVLFLNTTLALFFAFQWYKASNLDNVYLLAPDQTLVAEKTDGSLARSEYEIRAFATLFLEKAFAHNEYNWEENLTQVTDWMDHASAKLFLSKMDENIEALYKERNAISTVKLEEIELGTGTRPFELLLYYKTRLQFAATGEDVYEQAEVGGGIYLQLFPMLRSGSNPFGLQVRALKFIKAKES